MQGATLAAMHYLTISEYARMMGVTRQSVQGKIDRKKLRIVTLKVPVKRIAVEDIEAEKRKAKVV